MVGYVGPSVSVHHPIFAVCTAPSGVKMVNKCYFVICKWSVSLFEWQIQTTATSWYGELFPLTLAQNFILTGVGCIFFPLWCWSCPTSLLVLWECVSALRQSSQIVRWAGDRKKEREENKGRAAEEGLFLQDNQSCRSIVYTHSTRHCGHFHWFPVSDLIAMINQKHFNFQLFF